MKQESQFSGWQEGIALFSGRVTADFSLFEAKTRWTIDPGMHTPRVWVCLRDRAGIRGFSPRYVFTTRWQLGTTFCCSHQSSSAQQPSQYLTGLCVMYSRSEISFCEAQCIRGGGVAWNILASCRFDHLLLYSLCLYSSVSAVKGQNAMNLALDLILIVFSLKLPRKRNQSTVLVHQPKKGSKNKWRKTPAQL